jgi:Transcriptional regulator C-terminal region
VLNGQGAGAVTQRIREYLARIIQGLFQPLTGDALLLEIIATYMVGTLVTLIAWWLEKNMPYSTEYMSQVFFRLTSQGVIPLLGNTPNSES